MSQKTRKQAKSVLISFSQPLIRSIIFAEIQVFAVYQGSIILLRLYKVSIEIFKKFKRVDFINPGQST